jgi:hypothetical protein
MPSRVEMALPLRTLDVFTTAGKRQANELRRIRTGGV